MQIPIIELLAQIVVNGEGSPAKAPKAIVKRKLRQMFTPIFGKRAGYQVERLVIAAKSFGLILEDDVNFYCAKETLNGREG